MPKVRVAGLSMSIDGFSAGPLQRLEDPLGQRGPELFQWFFPTKSFCDMVGKGGGETGVDNDYAVRSMSNFGAFYSRPQYVRTGARAVAERRLERVVGRKSAVPRADVYSHAPRPSAHHNAGRNHIPLRDRRHRVRSPPGPRSRPARKMSKSAAASRRSGSISKSTPSTRFTSPFRQSFSAAGRFCWRASIWPSWVSR